MKTENITVRGHKGTWYAIGKVENINNEHVFYLLEHETHGEDADHIAIDEQGHLVMEDITGGMSELEEIVHGEYRICSKCGKIMTEGYCINGGAEYYCTVECLGEVYTADEIIDLNCGEDDSDNYWTTWE